jgi:hypothetical protein
LAPEYSDRDSAVLKKLRDWQVIFPAMAAIRTLFFSIISAHNQHDYFAIIAAIFRPELFKGCFTVMDWE